MPHSPQPNSTITTYTRRCLAITLGWSLLVGVCQAQNPVVQSIYTADAAPLVHDDTLYLYTGHDEDDAPDDRFVMHDYRCFSTTDMVNWTDHGPVLDVDEVFAWSGNDANAAQVIYRNGTFYYYVSTHDTTNPGVALGVAVSMSPTGPFTDALGHALVTNDQTTYASHSWDDLDPSVFIDDDGQAYLYWGNNALYFAKLNEDMISLDGPITAIPLTEDRFGPDFEEAPWVYKRDGRYYMAYASSIPESIHYATSAHPTGPWTYGGLMMDIQPNNGSNHPAVIDYRGSSYFFYHTAALPRGFDKRRSVSVERFTYDADGRIPEIPFTDAGIVDGVATLDPFARTEAETIAWASGTETDTSATVGVFVTNIDGGDYLKVRDVDFGDDGMHTFHARVASDAEGGAIEVRLDSPSGRVLGTLQVEATGGWHQWATMSIPLRSAGGVHDVYLTFTGPQGSLFNFDWWRAE